jgi:uncharacterized Zn ribbon protein
MDAFIGLVIGVMLFCLIVMTGNAHLWGVKRRDIMIGTASDGWAKLMARQEFRGRKYVRTIFYWAECVDCGYEWPTYTARQEIFERTAMIDAVGNLHAPSDMLRAVRDLPEPQQITTLEKNCSLQWHRCQAGSWLVSDDRI